MKGSFKGSFRGSIVGFYDIGALIIRIGFWGPFYYNYNQEPPTIVLVILKAPILG